MCITLVYLLVLGVLSLRVLYNNGCLKLLVHLTCLETTPHFPVLACRLACRPTTLSEKT